jgi:hypothetical protein
VKHLTNIIEENPPRGGAIRNKGTEGGIADSFHLGTSKLSEVMNTVDVKTGHETESGGPDSKNVKQIRCVIFHSITF